MQTVAEYFSVTDWSSCYDGLNALFMGYFPDSSVDGFEEWGWWPELFKEARAVIDERAEMEFLGEATAAQITDAAMKRFLTKNGARWVGGRDGRLVGHDFKKNVPPVWVSVMNQLRERHKRPVSGKGKD
jgi:hypothetical protein